MQIIFREKQTCSRADGFTDWTCVKNLEEEPKAQGPLRQTHCIHRHRTLVSRLLHHPQARVLVRGHQTQRH